MDSLREGKRDNSQKGCFLRMVLNKKGKVNQNHVRERKEAKAARNRHPVIVCLHREHLQVAHQL